MVYTLSMATRPKGWRVLYYEDTNGRSQVLEFIDKRKPREKAKVLALLQVLEERGPQLPRPYADLLQDGIHELRVKLSGNQVRVLYFFCYRDFIVLTNVFAKTTRKVPTREIRKAASCRQDFLGRFDEQTIRSMEDENT